jgi:hypothetical protein
MLVLPVLVWDAGWKMYETILKAVAQILDGKTSGTGSFCS